MIVDIDLGKVIATIIGFLTINAIATYFWIVRRQIIQEGEIKTIQDKLGKDDPSVIRQDLNKQIAVIQLIKDQLREGGIAGIQETLGRQKLRLEKLSSNINELKLDIEKSDKDYNDFSKILEGIESNSIHLDRAKKLLEMASENTKNIDIIDELNKLETFKEQISEIENKEGDIIDDFKIFKQQISKIEDAQKSQGIIKVGKGGFSTTELTKGEGYRSATTTIKFDNNFENGTDIKVFVALKEIEAKISKKEQKIRFHIYTESINNKGFTVIAKTWNTSLVDKVGFLWIAIGKPKQ